MALTVVIIKSRSANGSYWCVALTVPIGAAKPGSVYVRPAGSVRICVA
jgi:hypothetical protein